MEKVVRVGLLGFAAEEHRGDDAIVQRGLGGGAEQHHGAAFSLVFSAFSSACPWGVRR